ncbi:hypothetical protein Ae201684P_007525 [Aphanomyces euteiches]|nr:hypothetical protein Ae201684P_007525 [Aphanomyces euteiches]
MVVWCTKHQRGPKATREYPKHTPQDVSPLVFSRLMTHLPRADLDPIFLGYASQRKSYRLQDCESGRTFECRSVKFVEDGAADENPNKSVQVDHSYTQPPGPQVVDDPEDADDIDDQPEQSPPRHQVTFTDDVTIRNSPSENPAQVESPHPEDPTSADDEEGSMSDSDVQVPEPGSLEAISGGFHQSYSVQSPNRLKWLEATQVEYDLLIENGTWTLTDLPPGREALKCKWLWRMKFDADGKLTKYKARLVLKGYMQQYGIDYLEIFAPVLRMNALRLLLCLVAHHAWKIRQMDVKTAFLNGTLDTDTVIFMEQPPGFAVQGEESKVCRLIKSIYGLKQAPRCWYLTLHSFLVRIGFELLLSVYVDDITITGNNDQDIEKACNAHKNEFKMTDLGELKSILGIKVETHGHVVTMSQQGYVEVLLDKFNMADCKPVSTPEVVGHALVPTSKSQDEVKALNLPYRELVGSLQYLVTATRPDIANAVRNLSKHLSKYDDTHWKQAQRVLKYLKGSKSASLEIDGRGQVGDLQLSAYCDADFANGEDRKSISGYVVMYGSCVLSYRSRKQTIVALSTAEAEYIALADCVKELLWFSELLEELGFPQKTILVHCDNQSAIAIAKNSGQHERTKHISTKYHFVRDNVEKEVIKLQYCPSKMMIADILTKAIPREQFEILRSKLGLTEDSN